MPEKKSSAPKNKTALAYLGPTIPGVVTTGTVFNNGLTPQLNAAANECPAVKRLLVDMEKIRNTSIELRDHNSAASICYKKVAEYATKKGENG